MSKHTPGPWTVEHDGDDHLTVIPAGRDYPICDLGSVDADDYDADVIAALWTDAHLIAAAPELLAACRAFMHAIRTGGELRGALVEQTDAAIAKAEGRA